MTNLKVFTGGGQNVQSASGDLAERIKALIYEYSGRIPLAAAVGVLDIVKLEIIEEQR
jgi:hypothetical protein